MKEKKFALIVEDEYEICLLVQIHLLGKNIDCQFVHNINMAKNLIINYKPNFIFLDNNLPDGLGFNFIPEFKNTVQGVILIAMTAQCGLADYAIRNGADSFLDKPFSSMQFNAIIDPFLKD